MRHHAIRCAATAVRSASCKRAALNAGCWQRCRVMNTSFFSSCRTARASWGRRSSSAGAWRHRSAPVAVPVWSKRFAKPCSRRLAIRTALSAVFPAAERTTPTVKARVAAPPWSRSTSFPPTDRGCAYLLEGRFPMISDRWGRASSCDLRGMGVKPSPRVRRGRGRMHVCPTVWHSWRAERRRWRAM